VLPAAALLASRARLLLATLAVVAAAAAEVDFNRDVRPILSDKCFQCHGPDERGRKAKLRLDTRAGALRERDGQRVIVPGRGAESELLLRVLSPHADEVMPPPEAKIGRLTPAEIDALRRWIDSGAAYQEHWAFVPPAAPNLPPAALRAGPDPRNGIDQLVFAALGRRKVAPQPEADPATLLRRVTFDLTGLPPSPAELAAFLADPAPDAYARTVDRLLASPRYGERMAADWLDLARYADSFGFQVDRDWAMWPWRDWVIQAFNRNLPWDQFVTWQLAGDLMPGATEEQRLATAFNRLNPQESEGGSVEEEYRVNYINDRTATFGTAFLGLTLDCARCHDHKFDPVTQKDYYQLFAFFDDIDEAGLYSFFTPSMPTPAMWLQGAQEKETYAAATAAVSGAEQALAAVAASRWEAFAAWLAAHPDGAGLPGELARFDFEARLDAPPGAKAPVTKAMEAAKLGHFASAVDERHAANTPAENTPVPGRHGHGLRLSGDHPVNTTLGNFPRHEPFSVALWLQAPAARERAVLMHRSRAWTDAASRGYELLMVDGRLQWSLIHFWPGDAIAVRTRDPLPLGRWVHVAVTNDGSSRAAGLRVYVDGVAAPLEVVRDQLTRNITGGGGDTITLGERFRDRGFQGGLVDELRVFDRALTPLEAAEVAAPGALTRAVRAPGARDDAALLAHYLAAHDPEYRVAADALRAARARQTRLAEEAREIMVMRELSAPKTAYILRRGEYDQRGEEVRADTPEWLPPFPADAPRNRLGLARWLTAPDHPLLARVTVNRFWQALFGRGLVKTAEDFGLQGERPLHPELLDWLAVEFVRGGWDVKALLRTIVLSHTYRQRSTGTPALVADDPENTLLARGPRHRLPAEMIRDQALALSGLLVERLGGPPVHPYDLPESFKPAPAGTGDALFRRSLYTFWRRNGPAPVLEAFDVPKRVVCVARRDTTNTALHAFVLLNGTQFVEAARALAEDLLRATAGRPEALPALAFRRVLGRDPDATEAAILLRLHREQLDHYAREPGDADCYLTHGSRPADPALPPVALAAAATLVNTLMNHDLFVQKR